MQALAVPPTSYSNAAVLLDSMHKLRARIFRDRMNWDVEVKDGREADQFDRCGATYILAVEGGIRSPAAPGFCRRMVRPCSRCFSPN